MPLIFLRLLWRSIAVPAYRQRWLQRLGIFTQANTAGGIWLHAVSLGEAVAAIRIVKELQHLQPGIKITITTTTPTGSAQVQRELGNSVFHVYVPYDLPWLVANFLRRVQPKICVILETEIWPNLIHQCWCRAIPVLIINARLSPRSVQRYTWIKTYLRHDIFNKIALIATQSALDQQNFIQIGMESARLMVAGNIKFDITVSLAQQQQGQQLAASWGNRAVWIAASTHAGEEQIILAAFKQLQALMAAKVAEAANPLLILVPRHPQRFAQVAELIINSGFTMAQRSKAELCSADTDVLLIDTIGELSIFYQAADVAFVGGSLVPVGGHNMLEAAAAGLPILSGAYLHNFREISAKLLQARVLQIVANETELVAAVSKLFNNREQAKLIGSKAKVVVAENGGATKHLAEMINSLMESNN